MTFFVSSQISTSWNFNGLNSFLLTGQCSKYGNDNENEEKIVYGDIYEVLITDIAGDKLLAKIIKKV